MRRSFIRVIGLFAVLLGSASLAEEKPVAVETLSLERLFDFASRYPDTEQRERLKAPAFAEILKREERSIAFMLEHAHIKNIWYQVYLQQLIPAVDVEKAMPVLRASLASKHEVTRRTAAYFLGLYEGNYDGADLLPLLAHEKTRGMAIRTFGKWGLVEQEHAVIALLHEGEERERVLAVNALRDLGGPSVVSELLAALNDDVFTVRLAAARGLAVLESDSVKAVVKRLDVERRSGGSDRLLRELIRTVGAMQSTRGDRVLKKLRSHANPLVARDAERALRKVFREVLGVE